MTTYGTTYEEHKVWNTYPIPWTVVLWNKLDTKLGWFILFYVTASLHLMIKIYTRATVFCYMNAETWFRRSMFTHKINITTHEFAEAGCKVNQLNKEEM